MSLFSEPKIDSHCHILDPARFPYAPDTAYRPVGQEIGTLNQLNLAMDAYGIQHALLVEPNSGYGLDNRCMLDAIANGGGRFKGIAVVSNDISKAALRTLKAAGVIGVAFNATLYGATHYADTAPMLRWLADLDMFVQVQTEHDQLAALSPMLVASGARILIDHCGRPTPEAGLAQPGFQAVLGLARTRRAAVKLSGYQKFSAVQAPYPDTLHYVQALLDAYTPDACVWASDWPFLKAAHHLDMGPLLMKLQALLPDPIDRHKVLWETPSRLFGFST
jgi:predicted TIM-barrel fold metal-dependent hydrolase